MNDKKFQANVDAASTAPSEITLLEKDTPDMQRFTAVGRPKPHFDPSISNTDWGSFTGSGAPNLLPVRFTDESIISVPIPVEEFGNVAADSPAAKTEGGSSWLNKIGKKLGNKERPRYKMVKMTRGDYLKYWARDEDGKYVGTEPEGSGRENLRLKLEQESYE